MTRIYTVNRNDHGSYYTSRYSPRTSQVTEVKNDIEYEKLKGKIEEATDYFRYIYNDYQRVVQKIINDIINVKLEDSRIQELISLMARRSHSRRSPSRRKR